MKTEAFEQAVARAVGIGLGIMRLPDPRDTKTMQDAIPELRGPVRHAPDYASLALASLRTVFPVLQTPPDVHWQPHPDITPYETALAIPLLIHLGMAGANVEFHEALKDYPIEVRRHFTIDGEDDARRGELLDAIEDGIAGRVRS